MPPRRSQKKVKTQPARPTSPTSLLWAFDLRRKYESTASRLDAIEKAVERRDEEEGARATVGELKEEVRDLGGRIGALEERISGLERSGRRGGCGRRREEESEVKEDGGRVEEDQETYGTIGDLVNANRQGSQATTVGDEETQSSGVKMREENVLFNEIDALQQDDRGLVEYVEFAKEILKRAPEVWERYIVESFVEGIADEEQQELVANILDKDGYTWARANQAVREIEDRNKRKSKKRYIVRPEELEEYMNVTP